MSDELQEDQTRIVELEAQLQQAREALRMAQRASLSTRPEGAQKWCPVCFADWDNNSSRHLNNCILFKALADLPVKEPTGDPTLPEDSDERIAKWCGWSAENRLSPRSTTGLAVYEWRTIRLDGTAEPHFDRCSEWGDYPKWPQYRFNLNACAEFEALLKRRNLKEEWLTALTNIVQHEPLHKAANPFEWAAETDWLRTTANAAQRCAAMLKVMEAAR